MDQQNQNQPLASSTPPIPIATPVPSVPPVETPVSTPQPEMPAPKTKKKGLSVVAAVAALLLVVGVAGAAYYVSNQLSTRQAVAPNAPTSKPAAGEEYCPGSCEYGYLGGNCHEDQCGYGAGTYCRAGGRTDGICCRPISECPSNPTPVDGGWSGWSACSATICGTTGTKTRTCNNPAPSNGGAECTRTDGTKTTSTNRTESASCSAPACDCSVKYFCNTSTYTCQATTGTFQNTAPYISCDSTITPKPDCATSLANDTANPDTGVCYPNIDACSDQCKRTEVGACVEIKVYKKNTATNNLNILTQEQLQNLKIGDSLTFVVKGSIDGLKGRFRVTIDDVAGEWLTGTNSTIGTEKVVNYQNYLVEKTGTYKFEAQVSTTP